MLLQWLYIAYCLQYTIRNVRTCIVNRDCSTITKDTVGQSQSGSMPLSMTNGVCNLTDLHLATVSNRVLHIHYNIKVVRVTDFFFVKNFFLVQFHKINVSPCYEFCCIILERASTFHSILKYATLLDFSNHIPYQFSWFKVLLTIAI